jgi:hypothetical protein
VQRDWTVGQLDLLHNILQTLSSYQEMCEARFLTSAEGVVQHSASQIGIDQ